MESEKAYTIYEIEKLTKGRLSKYKLNLAIETKELKAKKVGDGRNGRGAPKFIIFEKDLNDTSKQSQKLKITNKT
jgi:hypothetical protein